MTNMPRSHRYNSWRMTIALACAVVMLLMLALVVMVPTVIESAHPCNSADYPAECEALAVLYFSTGGKYWQRSDGWLNDVEVCGWYGIVCFGSGRVFQITLPANNLSGDLPPEIGNLSNLIWLYLGGNTLASLPPEIGNLTNLQSLYLWGNGLTNLPPEFGNLSNLRVLNVGGNTLTSLPPEFGGLSNLRELFLWGNMLTSLPPEIAELSNLRELILDGNPLTCVPEGVAHLVDDLPACEE